MKAALSEELWSLEVVKGRDAGARYGLAAGKPFVLGVGAEATLDLARHEIDGPRRVEARHAEITLKNEAPTIRDLDSLGGTFVNRKRLLQGRAVTLVEGDIVQLAGVQLKVNRAIESVRIADAPPSPSIESAAQQTKPHPSPVHTSPSAVSPAPKAAPPAPKAAPLAPKAAPPAPKAAPLAPKAAPLAPNTAPHSSSSVQHVSARSSGSKPFLYTLPSGSTCRTWDDFLTVAAQRWREMCDELTSGRLERFLISIGRSDLAPVADEGESPDVRLDRWLDGLPTTKAAVPELDLYPTTIKIKASRKGGGGITKVTFVISNTGYRLLRSNIRIDADSRESLRVPAEFERPFLTIDETTIPIETTIPETLAEPVRFGLAVESNGGSKHIDILIEAADPVAFDPLVDDQTVEHIGLFSIADCSFERRLALFCMTAAVARTLVALGGVFAAGFAGTATAFAAAASLLAAASAIGRKSPRDLLFAMVAGGVGGMIVASPVFAVAEAIEPIAGRLGRIAPIAVALWTGVAAVAAVVSVRVVPPRETSAEPTSAS